MSNAARKLQRAPTPYDVRKCEQAAIEGKVGWGELRTSPAYHAALRAIVRCIGAYFVWVNVQRPVGERSASSDAAAP